MTPAATILITLAVGILAPVVTIHLQRKAADARAAAAEKDQDVTLAVLGEKVDALPGKMNGMIFKALVKHQEACPWAHREPTSPGA